MYHFCKAPLFSNDIKGCHFCWVYLMVVKLLPVLRRETSGKKWNNNSLKMYQRVKYLQRVPLDVSINWWYLHEDAGKNYSEISNMRSYWKYSKATICRHMKKNIGGLKNIEYCKKRVIVKAGIPPSVSEKTVGRVLQKILTWNGLIFREKEYWPKMTRNWDLRLGLLGNVQCATMKYEIIRKPV